MLRPKLSQLGLSENEVQVYLYLLEHGKCTIRELISRTGLPVTRQTVYNIINQLAEKGLVMFSHKNKLRYIETTPPNSLRIYIEKKQKELDEHRDQITALVNELELHKDLRLKERAVVEFYEGEEMLPFLSKYFLNTKSAKTVFLPLEEKAVYWNNRFMQGFTKRRLEKGLHIHALMNIDESEMKKNKEKIQAVLDRLVGTKIYPRFLPKDKFPFMVEVSILDSMVTLLNFHQKPEILTIIKDLDTKITLEAMFDASWESSKDYTEYVLKEYKFNMEPKK